MPEQLTLETISQKWTYGGWPYERSFTWKDVLTGYDEKTLPVSTVPLEDGTYYIPTSYASTYCRAAPMQFSVKGVARPQGFPVSMNGYGRQRPDEWFAASSGLFWGCFNTWPHRPIIASVLDLQLREKLAAKALNSDFNLGQTLGELPGTVRMIAEIGIHALRLIRSMRSGNVGSSFKQLLDTRIGELAGHYLTYQYGIKPLINDAFGLAQTISKGLHDPQIVRVKATVWDTNFGAPTPGGAYPHVRVTGTFKRGITGQYVFSVRDKYLYALDQLGILNPYALAWELFPLSFVIDWFLHIGSFLQGLSLPIALKFEHGYHTGFVNNTWEAIDHNPDFGGTRPRIIFRQMAMQRNPKWDFPFPLPYFHPDLNLSKVISMIALALATKRGK